jgi:hypothetical protein
MVAPSVGKQLMPSQTVGSFVGSPTKGLQPGVHEAEAEPNRLLARSGARLGDPGNVVHFIPNPAIFSMKTLRRD